MRILVVSQYFWPENFRINDLTEELVKRGNQVTVLTGLPNYPDGIVFKRFREEPSAYATYAGVEVIRVPLLPRGIRRWQLALNYLCFAVSASIFGIWKLRGRTFDVIFVYGPSPVTACVPAVFLRALKRVPLAFWVLDLWPETLRAVGVVRSSVVLRVVGWLVALIYRHCDLILAQSQSFIPQIYKYTGETGKVVYFPSWADAVFDTKHVALAAEVPARSGTFNVMFAGNIGEAQDFPAILSAAERLKNRTRVKWLIVGDGRMARWVAREIARLDLQDCVFMLGRHPVDRMPSFFKHADALLVSLKSEPIFALTIPGKLQSYLSVGIPIVAMLNGEGADLVRTSRCGLACPAGDHAALAEAVSALSEMSDDARQTMGANGRELSIREFDRTALIDRLENLLRNLRRTRARSQ